MLDKSIIIFLAIPVFFLMIAVELVYGIVKKKNTYRINDAFTSITIGLISRFPVILNLGFQGAIFIYFADKFKVSIADLSKETVSTHFYSNAIDIKTEKQFIALLDECEFARYTPASNKNAQMGDVLNKAKHIIIEVETVLR